MITKKDTSSFTPSTPKQKKFIFWHLGLDVKECNLSLSDAADLIGQMKKDPKFVYDYLVRCGAKVLNPEKLQKAINKKDKSMIKKGVKTKAEQCQELYKSDVTLTAKQIAEKVDCDLSVVYRSLSKLDSKQKDLKQKIERKDPPLKYRQVLNHIKKTPNLQGDSALTLENLAESYNQSNNTNYNTNEFSRCMVMIVKKNYASKVGKGVYSLVNNTSAAPISVESEIQAKEESKPIIIGEDKAYEYAVALHKIVGREEAHKLIDMISKLSSYIN